MLPACSLYSAMVAYSLRRYIWMTFSMCSFRSASFCSICAGLRPDAAVDELLLVIGQVHDAGEVLAQPDGVNDGEVRAGRAARRKAGAG